MRWWWGQKEKTLLPPRPRGHPKGKMRITEIEPGKWKAHFTFRYHQIRRNYYGKSAEEVRLQINQIKQDIINGENPRRKSYKDLRLRESERQKVKKTKKRNALRRKTRRKYGFTYRQIVRENFPEIDKFVKAKIILSKLKEAKNAKLRIRSVQHDGRCAKGNGQQGTRPGDILIDGNPPSSDAVQRKPHEDGFQSGQLLNRRSGADTSSRECNGSSVHGDGGPGGEIGGLSSADF
jgi:hypothetical protein